MTSYVTRLILIVLFIFFNRSIASAKVEIFLNHPGTKGSLYQISSQFFAEKVSSMSRNEIKITVMNNSQLGSDESAIGSGQLQLSGSYLGRIANEFEIFTLPYLINNRDQMRRIDRKIIRPYLSEIARRKGIIILGVWEYGFMQITSRKRPVNKPSDLKGVKLSTFGFEYHIRAFEYLGASPVPIMFADLFPAIERGIVDATEMPLSVIKDLKMYQVQKYLSITNHAYFPAFLIINAKRYSSFSPEVQKLLLNAANDTQNYTYVMAQKLEHQDISYLKEKGMVINHTNNKEMSYRVKGVYDEFARKVEGGSALISKFINLE